MDRSRAKLALTLYTVALSSRSAELLRRTKQYQRRRALVCSALFRAAVTAGLTVQRDVWCRPTSQDWWERIVLQTYDDDRWREDFRMSRGTFNLVCDRLRPSLEREDTQLRRPLTVEKRTAIALYWLATGTIYRTVASLFGVGISTVCGAVHEVCTLLSTIRNEYISLPVGDDLQNIINGFKTTWGFPQCAGAIDGSHIPVVTPVENHTDYFNRKGWHSILLQAVADDKYRFTNINVGWPGSVHDCRVLRNSEIYARAERETLFPPDTEVICDTPVPIMILGDPAYPLRSWLMKGYPDTGRLREDELYFNQRLSRARMTIECSFGRLKGRWQCLGKRLDVDIMNVPHIVTACCVLHNICENQGEACEEEYVCTDNAPQPEFVEGNNNHHVVPNRVREALTRYFQQ